MDYDFLKSLRNSHPAWRLLAADNAAFVLSFLHGAFVQPNVRAMSEQDLSSRLDDYLYRLRARLSYRWLQRALLQLGVTDDLSSSGRGTSCSSGGV